MIIHSIKIQSWKTFTWCIQGSRMFLWISFFLMRKHFRFNKSCVQIAHSTNGPPFDSFDVWFESLQRHSTCCRLLITFLDSIVVSIPAVRCKGSRAASKKLVANVGQVFKWLFNEIPVLYWMGVPPIQCRVPEIGGRIEFEASEPPLESRPLLFMVDRRWMLLLPTAIQKLEATGWLFNFFLE